MGLAATNQKLATEVAKLLIGQSSVSLYGERREEKESGETWPRAW